jgi:hypothetical protein
LLGRGSGQRGLLFKRGILPENDGQQCRQNAARQDQRYHAPEHCD